MNCHLFRCAFVKVGQVEDLGGAIDVARRVGVLACEAVETVVVLLHPCRLPVVSSRQGKREHCDHRLITKSLVSTHGSPPTDGRVEMYECLEKLISSERPSNVNPRRWTSADWDAEGLENWINAWSCVCSASVRCVTATSKQLQTYGLGAQLLDPNDVAVAREEVEQVVTRDALAEVAHKQHGRRATLLLLAVLSVDRVLAQAGSCGIRVRHRVHRLVARRLGQVRIEKVLGARSVLLDDEFLLQSIKSHRLVSD
jgi:hypothetical protein